MNEFTKLIAVSNWLRDPKIQVRQTASSN